MKVKNIILTILLILSVVIFLWMAYEPPKPIPETAMFSMELEVPKEVEAGKAFTVNGFLRNDSKHDWFISHGADMFRYRVLSEHGEPVPRDSAQIIGINNIGMGHLLKSKTRYTNDGEGHVSIQLNELKINEPGKYLVTSYASFSIPKERNDTTRDYYFELESEPVTVIVR